MNKEFILYEEALALKELGFDEPVRDYYRKTGSGPFSYCDELLNWNDDKKHETAGGMTYVSAPLYQQVFRWFREKHNIYSSVYPASFVNDKAKTTYGYLLEGGSIIENIETDGFEFYEEAELACIREMIKIVKK